MMESLNQSEAPILLQHKKIQILVDILTNLTINNAQHKQT